MTKREEAQRREDPVELLMVGADADEVEVARKLATAFRLAALETADVRSPSTGVEPGMALAALREHDLREAMLALKDLLVHHAAPCRLDSSFAVLPRPRASYTESLRSLLKLLGRRTADLQFRLPAPETPPRAALKELLGVVKAWVQHPEVGRAQADSAKLWEARYLRYGGQSAEACELLEEVLKVHAGANDRGTRELRAEVLAELVSIHIDAGELREARQCVARGGPSPKLPADVRGNLDALALALGWLEGGQDFPALEEAFLRGGFDVPAGWHEMIQRAEPEEGAAHQVPLRVDGARGESRRITLPTRSELGAQAVVFLVLDDEGRLRRGAVDVAPALDHSVDEWVRRWRSPDRVYGSMQQEALRGALPVVVMAGLPHPTADDRLARSCIDAERGCPLAAIALPIEQGDEIVGLLWMEFAHRRLPGNGALRSVAERAVGHPLLRHRVGATVHLTPADGPVPAGEQTVREDLRRLWGDLVEDLALKTAERRWAAFQRIGSSGDIAPVASGGAGGDRLGDPSSGGLWAIRRALGAGGFVRYEGDPSNDSSSMLHPGAAAGVAIAVPGSSGAEGVLIIESVRRGDSRERDAVRWSAILEHKAPVLQCAALDFKDRVEHAGGLVLEALAPDERKRLSRIQVLASSRSDLIIRGEVGSGRRTMARAIHHARHARSTRTTLVQLSCFGLEVHDLEEAFAAAHVETVVLTDIERLDVGSQVTLTRLLDGAIHDRPRVIATGSREAAGDSSAPRLDGGRHPDLFRNLERVEVWVPPLRTVRHRIPPLARSLARRWERSARPGEPLLWSGDADEIEATLWRQPWEGNAVELEAVLRQALLRASGGEVTTRHLMVAFEDVGLEPVRRLPSRDPDARDIASALWATQTVKGRMNKTRAAAFCGWDPNTLAARLRDLQVSEMEDVQRLLEDSSA
jgi:hypothetical protein